MTNPATLIKAARYIMDSNNDNAARHRLRGTEVSLKIADQYDRETKQLQTTLDKVLAEAKDKNEDDDNGSSMANEGGIAP